MSSACSPELESSLEQEFQELGEGEFEDAAEGEGILGALSGLGTGRPGGIATCPAATGPGYGNPDAYSAGASANASGGASSANDRAPHPTLSEAVRGRRSSHNATQGRWNRGARNAASTRQSSCSRKLHSKQRAGGRVVASGSVTKAMRGLTPVAR